MAMKVQTPAFPKGDMGIGLELDLFQLQVLIDLCVDHMCKVGPSAKEYDVRVAGALEELKLGAELADRLYGRTADND